MNFEDYVEMTVKLLNRNPDFLTRLFFSILDFNNDGKVCEWDLFRAMKEVISQKE